MEGLTYLKAVLLGLVQGLTEFLPVSSSGHLMLLKEIFGIETEGGALNTLSVALHAGSCFAVAILYFKKVIYLFAHPVKSDLLRYIVATVPTVAFVLICRGTGLGAALDENARKLLPYAFLLSAVFLLLADGMAKNLKAARAVHKRTTYMDALRMGLMQCVSTINGVSRSGSTITGGIAGGLERRTAADFSFIMSAAAILGAIVLDGYDVVKNDEMQLLMPYLPQILAGMAAAFVSGIAAIKLMLAAIKRMKLKWFSLYLALLAALVFVNDFAGLWG